jgi:hypothetical protein
LSRHLSEVKRIGGGQRGEVKAYSAERKEAVLRRMMPPDNKAVSMELGRKSLLPAVPAGLACREQIIQSLGPRTEQ